MSSHAYLRSLAAVSFAVAFSFIFFPDIVVSARAQQPTTADLQAKIDPLVVDLKKVTAPPENMRALLKSLRETLDGIENKAPLDRLEDRVAEMKTLVDSLVDKDGKVTPTPWPGLVDRIGVLMDSLAKVEVLDPTAAATRGAGRLLQAVKTPPNPTWPPLRAAIVAVLPGLETIEAIRQVESIQRRAASLALLLAAAEAPTPETADFKKAMDDLSAALVKFRGTLEPQIQVIEASYGDLDLRYGRKRSCDVTAAMRTACDNHTSCVRPTAYTGLCSADDPLAQTPEREKAVWVLFRCLDTQSVRRPPQPQPNITYETSAGAYLIPLIGPQDSFSCSSQPPVDASVTVTK